MVAASRINWQRLDEVVNSIKRFESTGDHPTRSNVMGKGNKVRKKEVKKPKQDKKVKK
jgi:hypothetical protein